jgi:hypothetical protein
MVNIPLANSVVSFSLSAVEMHVGLMIAVGTWAEYGRKASAGAVTHLFAQGLRFGYAGKN